MERVRIFGRVRVRTRPKKLDPRVRFRVQNRTRTRPGTVRVRQFCGRVLRVLDGSTTGATSILVVVPFWAAGQLPSAPHVHVGTFKTINNHQ